MMKKEQMELQAEKPLMLRIKKLKKKKR